MTQTAIEYIFEQLEEQGLIFLTTKTNEMTISISASDYLDIKRLAKEMEKQQIIDAHIEGQRVFDKHPHTQWTNDQAEQYYTSTYGSKGSDDHIVDTNKMVSSQTEISDEEIEEFTKNIIQPDDMIVFSDSFILGARWYRDELKNKQ